MQETHPWQSAHDSFLNVVVPKLKTIGKSVYAAHKSGNTTASKIVSYYTMLTKSFDPLTLNLLEDAIAEYEKGKS